MRFTGPANIHTRLVIGSDAVVYVAGRLIGHVDAVATLVMLAMTISTHAMPGGFSTVVLTTSHYVAEARK